MLLEVDGSVRRPLCTRGRPDAFTLCLELHDPFLQFEAGFGVHQRHRPDLHGPVRGVLKLVDAHHRLLVRRHLEAHGPIRFQALERIRLTEPGASGAEEAHGAQGEDAPGAGVAEGPGPPRLEAR